MAAGLNIKINTKRLEKALKTCPEELNRVMPGVVFESGKRFRGKFFAERTRRGAGVRASAATGVRGTRVQGGLQNPSTFKVDAIGSTFDRLKLKIFTTSAIARLHEKGGIVAAKKGGSLAVPFSSLSKAEVKSARQLLRNTRNVLAARSEGFDLVTNKGRKIKSLEVFVTKGKKGTALLVQRVGKRLRVLFHLQRRVTNRPILGFGNVWKTYRQEVVKRVNKGISFALAAARRKAGAVDG